MIEKRSKAEADNRIRNPEHHKEKGIRDKKEQAMSE